MALKKWKDEVKKMEDFRRGELSGDYYYFYYKIPIIGRNSNYIDESFEEFDKFSKSTVCCYNTLNMHYQKIILSI